MAKHLLWGSGRVIKGTTQVGRGDAKEGLAGEGGPVERAEVTGESDPIGPSLHRCLAETFLPSRCDPHRFVLVKKRPKRSNGNPTYDDPGGWGLTFMVLQAESSKRIALSRTKSYTRIPGFTAVAGGTLF